MRQILSRLAIEMAAACLGESRREWAIAMEAELEAAREDGQELNFALGCLLAAWRDLPRHEEGRFLIASYLLAFALPIPIAAALATSILTDFPVSYLRAIHAFGLTEAAGAQGPLLNEANRSAIPSLAIILAAVAAVQLRIAWLVLERAWTRIAALGTLLAVATLTLVIFCTIAFASYGLSFVQGAALAVELALISALARWHARSFGSPPQALGRQSADR